MSRKLRRTLPLLCLTAAMGAALLLYATSQGIGILNDSVKYIDLARNLANGRGLYYLSLTGKLSPLTVWPPLYPAMLAGLSACGADLPVAARWVSVGFFAANILLVGVMVFLSTGGAVWMSVVGSVLALTSVLLNIHSSALTEPPFLFFGFLGLCLLAAHMESFDPQAHDKRPKIWLLLGSAVAVGLAFLTRYTGVVLVGVGVLGLLVPFDPQAHDRWSRTTLARRVRDAALFGVVSVVPVGVWIIRNVVVAGTTTGRKVGVHIIGLDQLRVGVQAVSGWFLRGRVRGLSPWIVLAVGCGAVAALAISCSAQRFAEQSLAARKKEEPARPEEDAPRLAFLPRLLILFICIYVPFLLLSISFVDAYTPLYDRTLAPVLMAGLVVVLWMVHRVVRSAGRASFARIAILVLGAAFVGSYVVSAVRWTGRAHELGLGYAAKEWRESEILALIRALPPDTRIYTNGPELVRFWTERWAALLPPKWRVVGGRWSRGENPHYPVLLERMKRELAPHGRGVVVLFSDRRFDKRAGEPTGEELRRDLPLRLVERVADGAIYELAR